MWIPIMVWTIMSICIGVSVVFLGEPGDLALTIGMVHEKGFIPMDHVMPMLVASMYCIVGGGSLGPGPLGGFVSRTIFRQRFRNEVQRHKLMGMSGALSAFLGCHLVVPSLLWKFALDLEWSILSI